MAVAGITTPLSRVQVSSSRGEVIKPLLSECRHSAGEDSDFLLEMQELYFLLVDFWSHTFPDDDNGWPRDLLAFPGYLQTLNPVLHPQKMLLLNKSKKLKKEQQRLLEEFGGQKKEEKKNPDSLWKKYLIFNNTSSHYVMSFLINQFLIKKQFMVHLYFIPLFVYIYMVFYNFLWMNTANICFYWNFVHL